MSEEQATAQAEVEGANVEAEAQEAGQVQETGQVEESATSEEGQETEQPKKHKGGFQRRIDQLTREKYEAQSELEQMRAQVAELTQASDKQRLEQAGELPMPKMADFGYDEDAYGAAVEQWHQAKVKALNDERERQTQERTMLEQQHQRQAALNAKLAEATAKYPDFMVKVNNPQLPGLQRLNPAAFEAVIESDKFADVSYYLANNPTELYEFQGLSPLAAIRKVTQIEGKIGQSGAPNTSPPPAPPSTVGGKGESVKNPMDLPMDEWVKYMDSKDPRIRKR